jgi:hypothetical protein
LLWWPILAIRVTSECHGLLQDPAGGQGGGCRVQWQDGARTRQAFGKYAEIEHIKTLTPADLDIFKEDNQVVIAFAYEKRIPLVANVSLLIDFRGSSSGRGF